ncbi:unnamed protein product, partial [Musa textilis]
GVQDALNGRLLTFPLGHYAPPILFILLHKRRTWWISLLLSFIQARWNKQRRHV